ncbi:tRNA (adenosine(37)-N6)-threonylcarbamoyltransferase complex transferase subunit TsaD [Patescibacteria group bacterium]|nr:tRNA (adenosine(37)-N6)-threonylcarbamoyltransferase complex transferase subunit TsaD [Patescibacteria group bacterium]
MKILAIETSCDETAASLCEAKGGDFRVLSNIVSSQINIHKKYGGVVPEVAARKHAEVIFDVAGRALKTIGLPKPYSKVDLIAVTEGPGLVTSLRVGVLAAQSISMLANIPLVGVNHIEAHLLSAFLTLQKNMRLPRPEYRTRNDGGIEFPAIGLIVSGGHTELVLIKDFGKYKIIGETRDDAVGEAFDKVAKMLNLGYPGGPAISREAEKRITNYELQITNIKLPRPMINSKDFDFSFSGLKTAVLYLTKKMSKAELKKMTPAICREFQDAAVEVLVKKTARAAERYNAAGSERSRRIKSVLVGGGVSANKELRGALEKLDYKVYLPDLEYTGDNATMIAFAGWKKWQRTKKNEVFRVKAEANLAIDKKYRLC